MDFFLGKPFILLEDILHSIALASQQSLVILKHICYTILALGEKKDFSKINFPLFPHIPKSQVRAKKSNCESPKRGQTTSRPFHIMNLFCIALWTENTSIIKCFILCEKKRNKLYSCMLLLLSEITRPTLSYQTLDSNTLAAKYSKSDPFYSTADRI